MFSWLVSWKRNFHLPLYYFQLLGLCPTRLSRGSSKLYFPLLLMISLIHTIFLTSMVLFVYAYSRHIFFTGDVFGKFNDALKYVAVVIAYYAILTESFVKREQQTKIWSLLTTYHRSTFDTIDPTKLWNWKQFNLCFYGYFGLSILIEAYRIPLLLHDCQAFYFWCVYIVLLMFSRSRHMQYVFYVNILHRQIELLCEELARIGKYSTYNRTKLNVDVTDAYNRFLCHRLVAARKHYLVIFQITDNINNAFGWSHLANLAHSFVQILTDAYWIYWTLDNKNIITFPESLLGVIPAIIIVILVFKLTTELQLKNLLQTSVRNEKSNVTGRTNRLINDLKADAFDYSFHAETKQVAFYLHDINVIGGGPRLSTLIESFSLQLMHEPIKLSAQGCFILDFSVLGDMITAIITYTIFFIQFTPKFKSMT